MAEMQTRLMRRKKKKWNKSMTQHPCTRLSGSCSNHTVQRPSKRQKKKKKKEKVLVSVTSPWMKDSSSASDPSPEGAALESPGDLTLKITPPTHP